MGLSGARPVVGTVPGTVPGEGGATPLARGGRSPLACPESCLVASGFEHDSDHGVGHQRAHERAVHVHGPSLSVTRWLGRRRDRLAPPLDSLGVLDRVKVSLASLAADATLTRSPRAHGRGSCGASPCSRAC